MILTVVVPVLQLTTHFATSRYLTWQSSEKNRTNKRKANIVAGTIGFPLSSIESQRQKTRCAGAKHNIDEHSSSLTANLNNRTRFSYGWSSLTHLVRPCSSQKKSEKVYLAVLARFLVLLLWILISSIMEDNDCVPHKSILRRTDWLVLYVVILLFWFNQQVEQTKPNVCTSSISVVVSSHHPQQDLNENYWN